MWFSLLVAVLSFLLVQGKRDPNALPHTKCERTWEKVGCFKDNTRKGKRTLPELLVNDRDPKSKAYDGHRINWHAWEESMLSLACRCANATRERGWKVFGLQFYGECWSGEHGETTFNKYGEARSSKCLQELVKPIPPCDINKDMECVGAKNTNYIYRLKDDVNECIVHQPCKNGGSCVNTVGGYNCKCPANYKGKNCEEDVNECVVSNPCKNGGKCQNTKGGYQCSCAGRWFSGKNCDQAPAECSSYSKLSNGSRASGTHRGNILKCDRNDLAVGWYRFTGAAGTRMPTSPVAIHHCGTHAPGWMHGQHPTKDDGSVKRKVCFNWNNNVCIWNIEISVRNCGAFYVYQLPKTPYCWLRYCGNQGHNTCMAHNPCQNGGTCKPVGDDYQCACPAWYKGRHCEQDVNECVVSNPCKNGGKCQNTRGGYHCTCAGRWFSGKNCDQAPAECSSYSKLRDASRASGTHRGNILKCDRNDLAVGWYRFSDAAGTRMPTSAVAIHHCGTHAPGWMHGQHPTKDDGSVKRKVCFNWNNNVCLWNIEISVRNCGAFYVYQLPRTPYCWLRYCGNQGHNTCMAHNPCQNGGTCKPVGDDYQCACPAWYKGRHCEQDVNECVVSNPCKNGGKCQNTRGGYQCSCPGRWFSGKNCDQAPAECSSYSKLSDASRASGTHRGNVLKCDRYDLADGWYRFTDAAGTRMPTSAVAIHHCGTHAPGWMHGQHPTKDDGSVKRKVCFNWNNNVCIWNIEISVRNCGAFYVYQLPRTPYCWLRYCGNQGHNTCMAHNPCQNGGTCKPVGDDYQCACPAWYKGRHCEQDVNECVVSNPCKNGGKCQNTRGGYQCSCAGRWFSGKNCDQAPAECSSYSKLSDASRASGTHRGNILKCDRNDLADGWYRFSDAAGTRMPTSPVAINHCGTHAPGWMHGQHPTKDDGSVKRKVCFNWSNNVCLWNIEISVRNCGAFYVYQLPRIPYCYLRYCGNQGHNTCMAHNPCQNGGTCKPVGDDYQCVCPVWYKGRHCEQDVNECVVSNPCKNGGKCQNTRGGYRCSCAGRWFSGKNCDQAPAECSSYSKLSDASRASGTHRGNILKCDRNDLADGWYRFTDAAGTKMPTSPVAIHHCGTHAPGWMHGQHPTKDDGSVKRKVCFNWSNNVCLWNIEISVRNCGAFYVYQLPRIPYCYLRYCGNQTHTPAECSSYSKLSDASRASGTHRGRVLKCDHYDLAVGWYRFTDAAGTRMPTSPVAINHCGTHAPGWMNGQHPTKDDGSVKRKVCFNWNNNVCLWNIEISVRNCGAFYVYQLPRIPYCYLRYCGNQGHTPAECSSYSKLSDASRASGTHRGNILKCDRNDLADGWYRFTDAAGTKMPTSPVAIHHCGTHAPGWMHGQHPTKDDGSVKRKVCFNWSNNVCLWNIEISVRNCGAFYVYQLPRIPYCYLRYCGNQTHTPAECSSYSKLSDASRASGTHRGRVLKCDHYDLAVGWYRFTDAAGTRMPTSPVAINHCGTHAPGWMNGQHPTKDDGSVKRKVCFNWNNNVCLWNIEISVRNCGAFYVYQLPRIPYCYLRYCGNQGHTPAECSSYSKLSDASRASGTHRGNILKCDRNDLADGWYRFTDAAGTKMPTSPVAIHHCGTHAPGWMHGQHPTKDDGSVKRKVCFNWSNNVCLWNIEISVRNCGAFYVYQLPRIPYCYLRYCGNQGHTPAECSSYSKLSDASRASGTHRGRVLKCDHYDLAVGWYRFTDAAGTRMPTSPVAINHCGTHAPGWMNGQHPTKDDGSVKRKVCFNWNNNVCLWYIEISVRNCGAFYVYQLPRIPYCYLRYCGNQGHKSPAPPCRHAMDVGIIMDRSGSVGYADFQKSKSFVRTLVHRFQISSHGTRVGIIAYHSSSHLVVKFSDVHAQTPSAMSRIIDNISYTGGGTRTDIALEMADYGLFSPRGGDRRDKPNVLVVITDGKTNRGSKPYWTVLRPLIRKRVKMIAVGVSSKIDYRELNEIANGNRANVIHVDKFEDLFVRLNHVLRASCRVK